ncbi:MAG: TRAP transporter TatT component family protein [bacterium]|nr:TRAP transporter TatT component family protein [bacterium]MDT8395203.1 TRAP transporter TatT component family protein [bacterium]
MRKTRGMVRGGKVLIPVFLLVVLVLSSCSFKKFAVNRMGDALAGGGSTYASDDNPELIRAATPFSLKLMESLLAESPGHRGLLLAAASGFTSYGYAFTEQDADEVEDADLLRAMELRRYARRLYLRARDYGLRGLETSHEGIRDELYREPERAVKKLVKKDVPLIYWTAASWGAAISLSKDDPDLIADLPQMEALIYRALELDEAYDNGAIHVFLIALESGSPGKGPEGQNLVRSHFERAVELSRGMMASPLVAMAENVSVATQDREEFTDLLNQALAIDADAIPEWRLSNLIMQRRAAWLLSRTDDLFLE